MLAIAAVTFNAASETFIRAHVRLLAPGATILVCQDNSPAARFGYPVFSNFPSSHHSHTLASQVARGISRRWINLVDPLRAGVGPKPTESDAKRLCAFLDMYKPIALLAEYGSVGLKVSKACALADIPLFVHFHGVDANILTESWSVRRDYRPLFHTAKGIVVTTEFLRSRLLALGCPESKLLTCPCGVDTESFRPGSGPKEKRILMVSRLVPQKGPGFSLVSFARIARDYPDAVLEIVGDGPLRNALESQASVLGIAGRVIFHGAREHEFVAERMKCAAVFIQHCITLPRQGLESQGLSILEAMAAAVPVVATRHGAIPEVVHHGVTGYLVDECNTVAMADAINLLLQLPAEAVALGQAGRKRVVEKYSQDFAINRLRTILGLTVSKRPKFLELKTG
jgi:glycosyltransferase involved in cell wall biosynthesis